MSTETTTIPNTGKRDTELQVTQFYGGAERGKMLQLTQGLGQLWGEPGFIQLTRDDAQRLVVILENWLEKTA